MKNARILKDLLLTSRMANTRSLWVLLLASCITVPSFTHARSLHFLQAAIQDSDEPDPDVFKNQLPSEAFSIAETTSAESRHQEKVYVSEIEGDSFAVQYLTVSVNKPSISLFAENDAAQPKLPSKIKEDSIGSILTQNGLPIGLLPSSVESYTLSDDGLFSVSLFKECYVDFDYEVYYSQKITGTLSYGAISNLSGILAKKSFLWLSVSGIRTDESSSSYICFDVGPISKRLSISQFKSSPVCKVKAMDLSALSRGLS